MNTRPWVGRVYGHVLQMRKRLITFLWLWKCLWPLLCKNWLYQLGRWMWPHLLVMFKLITSASPQTNLQEVLPTQDFPSGMSRNPQALSAWRILVWTEGGKEEQTYRVLPEKTLLFLLSLASQWPTERVDVHRVLSCQLAPYSAISD